MDLDDISKVRGDIREFSVQEHFLVLLDDSKFHYWHGYLGYRGAQGTTGTQASFLEIFHGDGAKIDRLNELLCEKRGFPTCYAISTQTYSRKVDLRIANALSSFGATVQKIASDVWSSVVIFDTRLIWFSIDPPSGQLGTNERTGVFLLDDC